MSAVDAVLAAFAWPGDDTAAALRSELRGGCELRVFRALEGDLTYVYATVPAPADSREARRIEDVMRAALPQAALSRLTLLQHLAGASAGEPAPFRYVVETDVLPESEADLNAWYDGEHLAGLASVPGTVRALRFRSDGHPRYHACYDLARTETLGSSPWLAVRGTPWSDRVRPAFFNTRRTMFRAL